jgi:phosphopantothenoylcysteine decarboxylase/phosphopantothenate--cysteine ligase
MANPIADRHILLGVTGSIAAYKAVDLASKLTQAGGIVDVILTEAASQFITPLTLQSVTGRRAYTDADLWGRDGHVQHIGLAHSADLLMIAPVSANTLARLAYGLADNLLCVTALAATCPLLLAPAMDGGMFAHPATQANLEILRKRGARIVGPVSGHLASGLSGIGRMAEPAELLGAARLALASQGPLQGRNVVVTAGGTQEPIDPVRVIANHSSGKQGYALAQAALDLGAAVTLISGPSALQTPYGAQRLDVVSSADMLQATLDAVQAADVLVMAAAVADFRPAVPAANKIKKEGGPPQIVLEHTADVLQQVAAQKARCGRPTVTVGFAAESQDLLENAAAKLKKKKLDLIAANDISAADAGFAVDANRVTLLFADGRIDALPLMSKDVVAERIMKHVVEFLDRAYL